MGNGAIVLGKCNCVTGKRSVKFDMDFTFYNNKKNSNCVKYYNNFKITFCFNF